MKTQKQLPNEFTFVCDEHSRAQLEKLGIVNKYGITIDFDSTYAVINRNIIDFKNEHYLFNKTKYDNYPLINLSDYIDQEQPELNGTTIASNTDTGDTFEIKTDGNRIPIEPKWQEKTRGGLKIIDIKETINEHWVVNVNICGDISELYLCLPSGINTGGNPDYDLVLIKNPIIEYLEKELEEVRAKEKEILEKIEELKK